jgi:hypothetical protein
VERQSRGSGGTGEFSGDNTFLRSVAQRVFVMSDDRHFPAHRRATRFRDVWRSSFSCAASRNTFSWCLTIVIFLRNVFQPAFVMCDDRHFPAQRHAARFRDAWRSSFSCAASRGTFSWCVTTAIFLRGVTQHVFVMSDDRHFPARRHATRFRDVWRSSFSCASSRNKFSWCLTIDIFLRGVTQHAFVMSDDRHFPARRHSTLVRDVHWMRRSSFSCATSRNTFSWCVTIVIFLRIVTQHVFVMCDAQHVFVVCDAQHVFVVCDDRHFPALNDRGGGERGGGERERGETGERGENERGEEREERERGGRENTCAASSFSCVASRSTFSWCVTIVIFLRIVARHVFVTCDDLHFPAHRHATRFRDAWRSTFSCEASRNAFSWCLTIVTFLRGVTQHVFVMCDDRHFPAQLHSTRVRDVWRSSFSCAASRNTFSWCLTIVIFLRNVIQPAFMMCDDRRSPAQRHSTRVRDVWWSSFSCAASRNTFSWCVTIDIFLHSVAQHVFVMSDDRHFPARLHSARVRDVHWLWRSPFSCTASRKPFSWYLTIATFLRTVAQYVFVKSDDRHFPAQRHATRFHDVWRSTFSCATSHNRFSWCATIDIFLRNVTQHVFVMCDDRRFPAQRHATRFRGVWRSSFSCASSRDTLSWCVTIAIFLRSVTQLVFVMCD